MIMFAVLLQFVGRFRVITLEPFLLIYFTAGMYEIKTKLSKDNFENKILIKLHEYSD